MTASDEDAQGKEDCGGAIRGGVVEVLDLVVEDDGESAGGAGNVAAEHEYDAELADGVEKTEHDGGQKRAAGKRNEDAGDQAHRPGSEEARGVNECGIDGSEARDQRLHGKGQAVDDGADDEASEGKGEGMAEEGGDAAAEGGAGAKENKKKEAEHGGRQNHGQRGQSFKSGEPASAAQHDERGERHGDGEKNRGGDRGETKAERRMLASPLLQRKTTGFARGLPPFLRFSLKTSKKDGATNITSPA